jgi:hypothetical protein
VNSKNHSTRELAKTVEELEIASQHKSQFVANMSHELRSDKRQRWQLPCDQATWSPLGTRNSSDCTVHVRLTYDR